MEHISCFDYDGMPMYRSWTLGVSESTYLSITQAIYDAVGPLTALGLTSSYQNEGSVRESNWQEGKGVTTCHSFQLT